MGDRRRRKQRLGLAERATGRRDDRLVFHQLQSTRGLVSVFAAGITADWRASAHDKWVVPFGGGIGRLFKIDKQPIIARIQAFYNVVKPTVGPPTWTLRFQLTPVPQRESIAGTIERVRACRFRKST
jgi:hypothetical protein